MTVYTNSAPKNKKPSIKSKGRKIESLLVGSIGSLEPGKIYALQIGLDCDLSSIQAVINYAKEEFNITFIVFGYGVKLISMLEGCEVVVKENIQKE